MKEDEDFVIVSHEVWEYLFDIYGGKDIPRFSIAIEKEEETEEGEQTKLEYMVELYWKKVYIYILPKTSKQHVSLRKPSALFISRRATVQDLRKRIAEILMTEETKWSLEEMINFARVWKLDLGETVDDLEKDFENEIRSYSEHLPIAVKGRVLKNDEIVDTLNIAESDILLYEIKYSTRLRDNDCFAFTEKQKVAKVKHMRNKHLNHTLEEEKMDETKVMALPLEKCLEQNSRYGLTGLQNLGNTCFMNSVIQCLANTEPLAKFFLFNCYSNHINERNPLGTRGKLAVAFAELLTELYIEDSPYVAPWDVKNIIARRAIQFQGFSQHDSQEMLSFLLETLHEDLNDITKKPYVEHKDSDGRKDEEVSKEYWEGFLKREKSIFIDLFYGQLKSRV